MAKAQARVSVLADRIASGQAEPISDEEQQIADGLRLFYEQKFGGSKSGPAARGKRYLVVKARGRRPEADAN